VCSYSGRSGVGSLTAGFTSADRSLSIESCERIGRFLARCARPGSGCDVHPDCTLTDSTLFFDMTNAPGNDALDGLKVDQQGNVYSTGPGGLWIISPGGKQLGLIKGPEDPHNMAWGDDDGRTLYITALTGIYRIRLNITGIRP